jgi:hypothetical protein
MKKLVFILSLLLSVAACNTSNENEGVYYATDGVYSKMIVEEEHVVLTPFAVNIQQTFPYEMDEYKMYIQTPEGSLVFTIINDEEIDGGIYGSFRKE